MSRTGPFPGMDPWLERSWGDIHHAIIGYARDALNDQLPDPLAARVDERVFVEAPTADERVFLPDVRVIEYPSRSTSAAAVAEPSEAAADPVLLDFGSIEITEAYLEIRDFSSGGKVVTLIELLSRSNKVGGEGRKKYLEKQSEALSSDVNVVEIDLLRGGRGVSLAAQRLEFGRLRNPYHISIYRQSRPTKVEFFPIALRSPLPRIRIPLRKDDTDVTINLQSLVAQAYVAAKYYLSIDYSRPPEPSLSKDDSDWANERIAQWNAARA